MNCWRRWRPSEPTDDEIRRLLARADRRTKRRRDPDRDRRPRLAAVAATATLAALPSDPKAPLTASSLLTHGRRRRRRPARPAGLDRLPLHPARSSCATATATRSSAREESWVDSDWQGRRISPEAKVVAGTIPPARTAPQLPADVAARRSTRTPPSSRDKAMAALRHAASIAAPTRSTCSAPATIQTPRRACPTSTATARWPRSRSSELPTDPQQLGTLLLEAHQDGRWTPGGSWNPLPANVKYDVLRDILLAADRRQRDGRSSAPR